MRGDHTIMKSFRLAPMSPLIRVLTLVLLALPPALAVISISDTRLLAVPALFLAATYAWIWLRFRPSRFVVHSQVLEVIWPLKHRELSCDEISNVRLVDGQTLRTETGWAMRIGAGGLWGGFGWLWTKRKGMVQMHVSRTDGFVWIDRKAGRPWLITPENPEAFVRALSGCSMGTGTPHRRGKE
jgi:hypothetical protein